jgi:hypothetical protein
MLTEKCLFASSFLILVICGCGGGSGGSNSSPPPIQADFSITASPGSLSLVNGGSGSFTVSIAAVNGFSGNVSVSFSGLPAGVTVTPATLNLAAGGQQQVKLSAAASIEAGAPTITFQGTSGSLTHSGSLSLNITIEVTSGHGPIRTRYVRTNGFAGEGSETPLAIYDTAHKLFFVSNTYMNEIDVFDAVQETETARIPVPLAFGIDISPTSHTLYAGTLVGDVYQVDTDTLTVTHRYPSASIGPGGYPATAALVLSDGRLALQGGVASATGIFSWEGPVVWDPVTNLMDTGSSGN